VLFYCSAIIIESRRIAHKKDRRGMKKTQDRKELVKEINKAASLYRQHLVGKRFLYVFDGRYIEVIYKAQNFRHLTGVVSSLSAVSFYKLAAQGKLSANQIHFDAAHSYELCARKAKHICEIATMVSSENFMLEEIMTDTKTFKFGATDLNFSLCLDYEYDEEGNVKGDCYVAESLRDEDCFSKAKDAYEVTHILTRPNDQKLYTRAAYIDKRYTIEDVPASVAPMISADIEIQNQSL